MDKIQINALLRPSTYPEATTAVTLVQTHISYIFITDNYVYKFKKPVDFGFLDFTSLEKRRFYCTEELRLNRRLSPDIYLGLAELCQKNDGSLSINGTGKVVDYAVKMVRLPEQKMMARLLDQGAVTRSHIIDLANLVAEFHRAAARSSAPDGFGTLVMIRENWDENLRQATPYLGRTIQSRILKHIGTWVEKYLRDNENIFNCRVSNGFIRECDGDLHSENICLDDKIHIFDCIEFNEKFRFTDTAADVAFMVMDLENHNRRDLSDLFLKHYISASGDHGLLGVLPLYLANRAFIRGKVVSFLLDDPAIPDEEKAAATTTAGRFFRLAQGYTLRGKLPLALFITCGPTGCGKSMLATEIAFQLGMDIISTDVERKRMAGVAHEEHNADIYTPEWTKRTYQRLEVMASERLSKGISVVVDGTFIRRSDRTIFANLAKHSGSKLMILRPDVPKETVKQRLITRAKDQCSISDGTWPVYQLQISLFEEPDDSEGLVIHLDASQTVDRIMEQLLEKLGLI